MLKKVMVLFMVLALMSTMVACSKNEEVSNDSSATNSEEKVTVEKDTQGTTTEEAVVTVDEMYPAEKVLIGVELYDPTESSTIALKAYFDYLAETFNVEFKYSEAIADADQEMKFIEDCAVAGAKGFFAYYNVAGAEQINKVLEYNMYFYGASENTEIYDAFKENPLYLGSIDNGNFNYLGGGAMGEWVLANGFDKVIYANGGADFGVPIFVERQRGFLDALNGAAVEVITVSGFPNEQFFADQGAALSTEGVDAVVASFNGVDFWAQPIATAGLSDTIKLGTFGALNDDFVNAFETGLISLLASDNIQSFGFVVPIICNAVDGNAEALQKDGLATKAPGTPWIIDSAQKATAINDIMKNDKVFSAEDFIQLIVAKNPDANSETITELIKTGSINELLAQ